jgi:hypothetical protein
LSKEGTVTRIKYCEKRVEECLQKVDAIQGEIDVLKDALLRGTDPKQYGERILSTGERMALEHCIADLKQQLHTAQQQLEAWVVARSVK